MKCPYCNGDMEEGYVRASHGAYWLSKKRDMFLFPRRKKGDVVLASMWAGSSAGDAYLCRTCNKVIIDINEFSAG